MEEESRLEEWIDPAYLRLVELVSSPTRPDLHVEGLRILAHLCRRAGLGPLPLQQREQVAQCEFVGIATLCRGEEEARYGRWPYSRETTLKWFVLLEALTVIRRFRRQGKTVIQIRLGKREPLSQAQLLSNLDDSARQYTNSKTRELLLRAKADLERYGVASSDLQESGLLSEEALQTVQRQLLAKLQESGVSRATSRKVALWLTSGPLAQIAKDYLHAVRAATTATGKAISSPHGNATSVGGTRGSEFGEDPGDSAEPSLISPRRFFDEGEASLERSTDENSRLLSFSGNGDSLESRVAKTGGDRRLAARQGDFAGQKQARTGLCDRAQGDSAVQEHTQPQTLPTVRASARRLPIHQGDADLSERREEVVAHTRVGTPSGANRLERDLLSARQGDSQRAEFPATRAEAATGIALLACQDDTQRAEAPAATAGAATGIALLARQGDTQRAEAPAATAGTATGIALLARQGDSGVGVSNSNSFSKDTVRESEFEFDTSTEHHAPESPQSPTERRAEATSLWRQLYSEEQRNAPGGNHLIGGLINKLNERPDLVRLAMVNVLLQRFFPDRHGPPDGCGAKWFYRSYAGYLSGQLTASPEIRSWAQSPYSYQQIERALQAESAYQQADVFGKPHRPSVSCIREHRLLSTVRADSLGESAPEPPQMTQPDGAPAAREDERVEHNSLEPEELLPGQGVCHPLQTQQAAAQPSSRAVVSQTRQRYSEVDQQRVVVVQDPQTGWTSLEGVLWWREQITRTSLTATCRLEVLLTEYGRYVLVVTPHDDEAAAWLWSSGRQVRLALEQWRAAQAQT